MSLVSCHQFLLFCASCVSVVVFLNGLLLIYKLGYAWSIGSAAYWWNRRSWFICIIKLVLCHLCSVVVLLGLNSMVVWPSLLNIRRQSLLHKHSTWANSSSIIGVWFLPDCCRVHLVPYSSWIDVVLFYHWLKHISIVYLILYYSPVSVSVLGWVWYWSWTLHRDAVCNSLVLLTKNLVVDWVWHDIAGGHELKVVV